MDNKEREIKIREINEKHHTEVSNDFKKREFIHKIVIRYSTLSYIICMLIFGVGIIFSLGQLISITLILLLISITILIIGLISSLISMNKTKKKHNKYLEEIDNLSKL